MSSNAKKISKEGQKLLDQGYSMEDVEMRRATRSAAAKKAWETRRAQAKYESAEEVAERAAWQEKLRQREAAWEASAEGQAHIAAQQEDEARWEAAHK
jgi:hypothetical protein